jgi:hypothetical protein
MKFTTFPVLVQPRAANSLQPTAQSSLALDRLRSGKREIFTQVRKQYGESWKRAT